MPDEDDGPEQSGNGMVRKWISIPPHLKQRLQALADESDMPLDEYVSKVIEHSAQQMARERDSRPFEFDVDDDSLSVEDRRLIQEFLSSLSNPGESE